MAPAPTTPAPESGFALELDGLCYQLDTLPTRASGRTVVAVSLAQPADGTTNGAACADPDTADSAATSRLLDRLDLFSFRSRRRFAQLVAAEFGREPDAVLGQLARLVDAIERAQAQAQSTDPIELTPERRQAALQLLRQPDLLDQAAQALDGLGLVGEPALKRLGYLVTTSRLLKRPLSALLSAPSSSGKSELLRTLARLTPPESVELLSRLTPASLYYAGPNALRHKVVMVDEHVGAQEAEHSLRTLLSQGSLTLRTSPRPGQAPVAPITVYGPIALLSGTTSARINEETLSRCLELELDESPAQTERVQAAQRAAWSGQAGPAQVDVQLWQDAQRLLEPLEVVIPFAARLRFPARTSHDRRDQQKLLGLVAAHALLYQRQRRRDDQLRVVATPADYAAVHTLVEAAVRVDTAGLSPRAARAYAALSQGRALTRRELAQREGWVYNTAKASLAELLAQELAQRTNERAPARYALVDRALLGSPGELLDPAELQDCKPIATPLGRVRSIDAASPVVHAAESAERRSA